MVDTIGTISNRDGIGARVTIDIDGKSQIREVSSGRSNMGQNMKYTEFQRHLVELIMTLKEIGIETIN